MMKALDDKDVLFKFPKILPSKKPELILKTPKTRSSVRKIWIPKTVAELLFRHRQEQIAYIQRLQDTDDEYLDFDLVLTEDSGRPYQSYKKHFDKLYENLELLISGEPIDPMIRTELDARKQSVCELGFSQRINNHFLREVVYTVDALLVLDNLDRLMARYGFGVKSRYELIAKMREHGYCDWADRMEIG